MHLRITTAIAALALFAATAPAYAQDNPENGDTGQWQQPNNGQQQGWGNQGNQGNPPQGGGQWNQGQGNPPQGGGQWNQGQGNQGQGNQGQAGWGQDNEHPHQGASGEGSGEHAASGESGTNDFANDDNHSAVVHHLGVGFFGIQSVPIGGGPMSATAGGTVAAPTIGMRYWLTDLVGLEAAIGLGFTSLNFSSGSVSVGQGSAFAIAFHVGLPLAIAHWKHFSFIAEPEIQVGFASGSLPNMSDPVNLFDDSYSGFTFAVGGRIGGEIQFGFIGVPQLSLQAGIGLHLTYSSTNSDVCSHNMAGDTGCPVDTSATLSSLNISTGVAHNPWDVMVANITAIYYL